MTEKIIVQKILLMTVDPVHVGTGGYRLGRVDLSIVREPGTRLPKIPGTGVHGAVRQYAAYRYGRTSCAGQKGHCGEPTCPVCYTFGYSKGDAGGYSGVVNISDARIFLFPVYSMRGPVWVTTKTIIEEAGFIVETDAGVNDSPAKEPTAYTTMDYEGSLNLGWLMVNIKKGLKISCNYDEKKELQAVMSNIVLVSDKLFPQIVNSNLEVRTSVSISPDTGAAQEGALFTYEAIPRATFLWLDVVVDDYRGFFPSFNNLMDCREKLMGTDIGSALVSMKACLNKHFSSKDLEKNDSKEHKEFEKLKKDLLNNIDNELNSYKNSSLDKNEENIASYWNGSNGGNDGPLDVVISGLRYAEYLGIGGMGTRGFGRIRYLASCNNGF